MTLPQEQAEIIVYSQAVDSYKLFVARQRRREAAARAERQYAEDELHNMLVKLQYMRESILRKGCV